MPKQLSADSHNWRRDSSFSVYPYFNASKNNPPVNNCVEQVKIGQDILHAMIQVIERETNKLDAAIKAIEEGWRQASLRLGEIEVERDIEIRKLKGLNPHETKGAYFGRLKVVYAKQEEFLQHRAFLDARRQPGSGPNGPATSAIENKARLVRWRDYLSTLKSNLIDVVLQDLVKAEHALTQEFLERKELERIIAERQGQVVVRDKLNRDQPPPPDDGFGFR